MSEQKRENETEAQFDAELSEESLENVAGGIALARDHMCGGDCGCGANQQF